MSKINSIIGRQVFDSRGIPTIEAEIILDNGIRASAITPSGASTGSYEAYELRDGDQKKFLGKSVMNGIQNINTKILKSLKNQNINDQKKIDQIMIDLDGTENKKNLGANAILAVSLSAAKTSAKLNNKNLYELFGKDFSMPYPLMNILNGGAHADNNLRIQEFMIRPDSSINFKDAISKCFIVIQNLKKLLKSKKLQTNVGDEGGFAPSINTNEDALDLIIESINMSNLLPDKDISICLDVAANELFDKKGNYSVKSDSFTTADETLQYYNELTSKYPIKSIEDPFAEDDWDSFIKKKIQIVGDDLFVTNEKRLRKGINSNSANCVLIKPNQIGTLTETLNVINLAHNNGYKTIISHRSGDSEDTFIADLSVGTNSSQIKTGSLARSERVAKYNRLLRIEENLGNSVKMAKV